MFLPWKCHRNQREADGETQKIRLTQTSTVSSKQLAHVTPGPSARPSGIGGRNGLTGNDKAMFLIHHMNR